MDIEERLSRVEGAVERVVSVQERMPTALERQQAGFAAALERLVELQAGHASVLERAIQEQGKFPAEMERLIAQQAAIVEMITGLTNRLGASLDAQQELAERQAKEETLRQQLQQTVLEFTDKVNALIDIVDGMIRKTGEGKQPE